jgi:glyoxylase-like metal-dependent hydrolase (beta-lactamase superfamily II)
MMNFIFRFLAIVPFALSAIYSNSQSTDILKKCWIKQVEPVKEKYISFNFTEERNVLDHNFKAWQTTQYLANGIVWANANHYQKKDSIIYRGNTYNSKTKLNNTSLLFVNYGEEQLLEVTESLYYDHVLKTIRYSPIYIINYLFKHNASYLAGESDTLFAVYKTKINKDFVKLYIRKADDLLDKITVLSYDELYGDVKSTFSYRNYSKINTLSYPTSVHIEKINGKVNGKVKILPGAKIIKDVSRLFDHADDIIIKKDTEIIPETRLEKYNDNIYFFELNHTDDRVMIVEFNDFLLVAEAPLNSENGELIISKTKEIAPDKEIKYFVFGHHHPHYLGGMRPFIHKGAIIISPKENIEYVTYLANAPHSLSPDSLQMQPKPLQIQLIKDSLTISDGKFEMKIYFIGEKSAHTNDYLIYYFPKEKLLFQDDLVWMEKEGEIKKAGERQAGLYNAILDIGIHIDTIIQSWPVKDYGVKTVIPFSDLEKSMKIE